MKHSQAAERFASHRDCGSESRLYSMAEDPRKALKSSLSLLYGAPCIFEEDNFNVGKNLN